MSEPIPTTLDEAVDQILAGMSAADKVAYAKEREHYPGVRFHFSGGMAMRNDWGLWHHETVLAKWLLARRLFHGDDRSAIVFKALWRRIHGLPLSEEWLATEAAHYETFWRETAGLSWDMQPIPGYVKPASRTLRVKRT